MEKTEVHAGVRRSKNTRGTKLFVLAKDIASLESASLERSGASLESDSGSKS